MTSSNKLVEAHCQPPKIRTSRKRRRYPRRCHLARFAQLHCEPLEQRRLLAVLTVNSELDNIIPGDGLVTLREAIIAANNNTTTDLGHTASLWGDQIVFDSSLDGKTIAVAIPGTGEDAAQTGDLDIMGLGDLTVIGNGKSHTIIDAQSIDRVFDIHRSSSGVTFENLTITGGAADGSGGAIRSLNELTIKGSTISGNTAGERGGGIFVSFGFTVANSTISGNSADTGGGIFAARDVTVENTTIAENSASSDGGIHADGNVTVASSAIWGNSSSAGSRSGGAGGISASGDVTIGNSTISENRGGGYGGPGGIKAGGNVAVANSTISGNLGGHGDYGGIITGGTLALTSSIVAHNGHWIYDRFGPAEFSARKVVATHSLIGDNTSTELAEAQTPDANGNLIGTTPSPIDPLLGPLQDNGGPTLTHALLPGSPAINAGSNPERVRFDQRGSGFQRVIGSAPDMGAWELQETFLTVNSELDNIIPGDGLVTLREAIIAANSDTTTDLGETGSGADWIVLDRSLDGASINLSLAGSDEDAARTGDFDITDPAGLRITGNVRNETIIDARSIDRVFDIPSTSGLFLFEHLTMTGGSTTEGGGAIRSLSNADVTIIGSTIFGNLADGSGGGIQTRAGHSFGDGNITVINSTIYGNSAGSRGGGIATAGGHDGGNVSVIHSTISGNTAVGNGGGIYTGGYTGAEVTVSNSTISGNSAGGSAGAISARHVTVTHSTISGNAAGGGGGGIFASFGNVTVRSSVISDNLAGDSGGGIFANDILSLGMNALGNVTLSDSVVSGNSAKSDGGGISALHNVTVENSTISGNSTSSCCGGGIFAQDDVTITSSTISGNSAPGEGGGIWGSDVGVASSIVARNTGGSRPDVAADSVSAMSSLIGNNSGTGLAESQTPDANYNLIGTTASPIDPRLGPLQHNGGPTLTHALLYGSPAIDAGNQSMGQVSDQRGAGFRRVVGAAPDMGALELQGVFLTVNSELDNVIPDDGLVTLREAIIAANNDTATDLGKSADGVDRIVFDPSLDGKTVALSVAGPDEDTAQTGDLDITDAAGLTIIGNGATQTIIDGQSIDRIFDVQGASGPVTIENLTITGGSTTGGNTSGGGGGIRSMFPVELTISGSTISGNSTHGFNVYGGGILSSGSLTIEDSTISGNSTNGANGHGGGIRTFGNLTVSNTTVSGNSARFGDGGGIDVTGDVGDSFTLSNSTISGNSGNYGGGLFVSGDAALEYSTISGNSAKLDGGAIFLSTGNLRISSSVVAENMAAGQSPPFPLPRPINAHDVLGDTVKVLYSLIGDNTGTRLAESPSPDANGNLIGTSAAPIDPLLEPLHDNGGPTLTHALLPGSPAIDAGKIELPTDIRGSFVYFDQRGESFSRIVGDRADMGALEVQATSEPLLGDLDLDGRIAFADFLILSANFGSNDVAPEDGDLNGDGAVSLADFLILSANFGKQRATAEPMSRSKIAVGVLATDKFFSQGGGELKVSERLAGVVSWKVSATPAREQAILAMPPTCVPILRIRS